MLYLPALPETRAPPRIGITSPSSAMPMRRLKTQIHFAGIAHGEEPGVLEEERPLLRKEQVEASRLICWSSTSTCAKSVFTVPSSARLGVRLYFRSTPTVAEHDRLGGASPDSSVLASAYGVILKLRIAGV